MKNLTFLLWVIVFFIATNAAHADKNELNNEFLSLIPLKKTIKASICKDNKAPFNRSVGLRTAACNLMGIIDLNQIERVSGIQIFNEGAKKAPFNTEITSSFNHYNPEFIKWILMNYEKTKDIFEYKDYYDSIFRDLVRIYYAVGYGLNNNPAFYEYQLVKYKSSIANGEKINPSSLSRCKNIYGSWPEGYKTNYRYKKSCYYQCRTASNVAYFWFRRGIDGSKESILRLLEKIVRDLDNEFYSDVKSHTKIYSARECIVEKERND